MRTVLRWLVGLIVVAHGLIHAMGAIKGFGWADVAQLKSPISTSMGLAWLAATVLVVAAGGLLCASVSWWWVVGAPAVIVSQATIFTSWNDAKAGTIVNAVLLLAIGYGFASQGPQSFLAEYGERVKSTLSKSVSTDPLSGSGFVTEADLAKVPEPVAAYLRRSGAVGQPRIRNFRAKVHGRIRAGTDKSWMHFTGEQVNTYGPQPSRLFRMDATMFGLPVDVLHAFVGTSASMRVRLCSVFNLANAIGPELNRAETVTMFNDLCVLAPAALLDAPVTWSNANRYHVTGSFTNGPYTVVAELRFNEDADLVDFISDDRLRASSDGKSFTVQRWSTPIQQYRTLGTRRVCVTGEARWHAPEPEGTFTYLEFNVDSIAFNLNEEPSKAANVINYSLTSKQANEKTSS
jgi:hypothetical protein